MAEKRFDIGEASKFQSRDGGITKGGLVKNGFTEKSPDGVWSWQRPALSSVSAAPFTGSGLTLIPYDGVLFAVGGTGIGTGTGTGSSGVGIYPLSQLPAVNTGWKRWDGILSGSGAPALGVDDVTLAASQANYAPIEWITGTGPFCRLSVNDQGGYYWIHGPNNEPVPGTAAQTMVLAGVKVRYRIAVGTY